MSLLLTGCVHEEDDIFDASAAERLNAASEKYTSMLQSSEGGWVLEYYPTTDDAEYTGTGYHWMVKFNKDMSVNVGMNNVFSGNVYREYQSLWEVITDNGPVLTFNSENPNVHAFSDPDVRYLPGSSTNVWGTGVGGDYEFVIVESNIDEGYVMLKGKKRGTYNRLTRLPVGTDFKEYIDDVNSFLANIFPSTIPNYNVITVGDSIMKVEELSTTMPNIYPYDGDYLTNGSYHPFMITKRNDTYYLRFRAPLLTVDGAAAQEFAYDAEADIFKCVANPEFTIAGADPTKYFVEELENGKSWRMTRSSSMSEAAQTLVDGLYNGLRARSLTFTNAAFTGLNEDGTKATFRITYRNSRNATSNVFFDYPVQYDGEQVVFGEVEVREASQPFINSVPAALDFLNGFTGAFVGTKDRSAFNLGTLQLHSASGEIFVAFTRV